MNYLLLQVLFIGLIFVALPLRADDELVEKGAEVDKEANILPTSVDGSAEISADKRYRLAGKRYRLHGKRGLDDSASDQVAEFEKRYRLGKKSFDENEDGVEMEKRYRLAGKRYRLMGKRYRLMGKRSGYSESDEDNSNESDDSEYSELQKRYRLSGNNVGGKRFKINKKYRLQG